VPVLPSPALQWIAIALLLALLKWVSTALKNSVTISSGGVDPSMKKRSWCPTPSLVKYRLSYLVSFSLITKLTPSSLNIFTYFSGWCPNLCYASFFSIGPMWAMNLPGMIQLRSPFSTRS
jgi:hypothetical protein